MDINRRLESEQVRCYDTAQRLRQLEAVNTASESVIQQLMARLAAIETQVSSELTTTLTYLLTDGQLTNIFWFN